MHLSFSSYDFCLCVCVFLFAFASGRRPRGMRRFATPACELRKRGFLFLFLLVHFLYSLWPLGLRLEAKATNKNEIKFGLCCILCILIWRPLGRRLEAKATNKNIWNEMNFCLGPGLGQLTSEGSKWGPFALVLHAYAAAATYAKARVGLGQLKSK